MHQARYIMYERHTSPHRSPAWPTARYAHRQVKLILVIGSIAGNACCDIMYWIIYWRFSAQATRDRNEAWSSWALYNVSIEACAFMSLKGADILEIYGVKMKLSLLHRVVVCLRRRRMSQHGLTSQWSCFTRKWPTISWNALKRKCVMTNTRHSCW